MVEWVFDFSERNRGVQQIDRVSERRHRAYVLWNDQAHCPLSWVMCQAKLITDKLGNAPNIKVWGGRLCHFSFTLYDIIFS